MAHQAAVCRLTTTCESSTIWRISSSLLGSYNPTILVEVVRTRKSTCRLVRTHKFTCRPMRTRKLSIYDPVIQMKVVRTRKSMYSPPSQLLEKPTEAHPKVSSRTEVHGHVIIAAGATSHRLCSWDPGQLRHSSLTLDETASQATVTTVATGHETTVVTTGADAATAVAVVIAVVDTVVTIGSTPLHLPLLTLRGRMFCSFLD